MNPFRHNPALADAQLAEEAEARRWLEMHLEMTESPRDFHLGAFSECGEEEQETEQEQETKN